MAHRKYVIIFAAQARYFARSLLHIGTMKKEIIASDTPIISPSFFEAAVVLSCYLYNDGRHILSQAILIDLEETIDSVEAIPAFSTLALAHACRGNKESAITAINKIRQMDIEPVPMPSIHSNPVVNASLVNSFFVDTETSRRRELELAVLRSACQTANTLLLWGEEYRDALGMIEKFVSGSKNQELPISCINFFTSMLPDDLAVEDINRLEEVFQKTVRSLAKPSHQMEVLHQMSKTDYERLKDVASDMKEVLHEEVERRCRERGFQKYDREPFFFVGINHPHVHRMSQISLGAWGEEELGAWSEQLVSAWSEKEFAGAWLEDDHCMAERFAVIMAEWGGAGVAAWAPFGSGNLAPRVPHETQITGAAAAAYYVANLFDDPRMLMGEALETTRDARRATKALWESF